MDTDKRVILDGQKIDGTNSPDKAIDFIKECNKNAIFIMCDFHVYFGVKGRQVDYNVVRRLRDNILDLKTSKFRKMLFLSLQNFLFLRLCKKKLLLSICRYLHYQKSKQNLIK